jgi:peptidoglycan/xylan/chitin deacetylase (PgdA/CDA1 family)
MKKIIISLDFEMMWGVHHIYQNKIEEVKKFFLKTPYIVSETLRMFKERDISATWAIVGALFMNDWHEYEKNNYYYRYDKKILNFNNNFKIKDPNGELFFAPNTIKEIFKTRKQELASHSFNHIFFDMPGITKNNFITDTNVVLKIFREKLNFTPISYVFPKNECVNIDYLKSLGFKKIRERMFEHYYNYKIGSIANTIFRPLRLFDNLNFFKNGSLETKDNYFFLRFDISNFLWNLQFEVLKKRIFSSDLRPFHIWWHPRDLIFNVEKNLSRLAIFLDFLTNIINKNNFSSISMSKAD